MREDEKERYLLQASLPNFKRLLERTREYIKTAFETCEKWGVSFSGGKDSQVILDLVYSLGFKPVVFYQSYGVETIPGNRRMFEWAKGYYHDLTFIEHESVGEIEVFRRVGHFFLTPKTKEEREAVKWWWKQSFQTMDEIMREHIQGHFWGIRAEESSGRRKMVGKYGNLFYNQSQKLWVCQPIMNWTGADVWAYIVSNDLPYCDIYDHQHFNREHARNEFVLLSGDGAIRHGSFKFWETYDPEWFGELTKLCPELKKYV